MENKPVIKDSDKNIKNNESVKKEKRKKISKIDAIERIREYIDLPNNKNIDKRTLERNFYKCERCKKSANIGQMKKFQKHYIDNHPEYIKDFKCCLNEEDYLILKSRVYINRLKKGNIDFSKIPIQERDLIITNMIFAKSTQLFIKDFDKNNKDNYFGVIYCNISNEIIAEYLERTFRYLQKVRECFIRLPRDNTLVEEDFADICTDNYTNLFLDETKYNKGYFFIQKYTFHNNEKLKGKYDENIKKLKNMYMNNFKIFYKNYLKEDKNFDFNKCNIEKINNIQNDVNIKKVLNKNNNIKVNNKDLMGDNLINKLLDNNIMNDFDNNKKYLGVKRHCEKKLNLSKEDMNTGNNIECNLNTNNHIQNKLIKKANGGDVINLNESYENIENKIRKLEDKRNTNQITQFNDKNNLMVENKKNGKEEEHTSGDTNLKSMEKLKNIKSESINDNIKDISDDLSSCRLITHDKYSYDNKYYNESQNKKDEPRYSNIECINFFNNKKGCKFEVYHSDKNNEEVVNDVINNKENNIASNKKEEDKNKNSIKSDDDVFIKDRLQTHFFGMDSTIEEKESEINKIIDNELDNQNNDKSENSVFSELIDKLKKL